MSVVFFFLMSVVLKILGEYNFEQSLKATSLFNYYFP